MTVNNFKDLIVWQKSMDLAVMVYAAMKSLPKEELFALSDQICRAVVSIPSNIAEGHQRSATKEYKHFLRIAKGSLGELETQIFLCERLNYLTSEQTQPIILQCSEIGKMLNGLINSLRE